LGYVIYGAGAVGGVIAARLSLAGLDVRVIARGAHLEALRARGLVYRSPAGEAVLPLAAFPSAAEAVRPGDTVFLAMKTQDTWAALVDLRGAAGPDVAVVCAQNGVENERLALRLFERVYAMLVILPATHLEAGVVESETGSPPGLLDIGRYPSGSDAAAEAVAADLGRAGFVSQAEPRVMRLKYAKLLTNLRNVIEAACGVDIDADDVFAAAVAEAEACFRAAGIEYASVEELVARRAGVGVRAQSPARRVGGSTWQSLARGSPSLETDYLNGEVVLLGRLHGVPTPINAALQAVGARLALERRQPGSLSAAELRREAGL
jgi:2-dehydropantoate 2-reductase